MKISKKQLAEMLDHTLVKSDATKDDVKKMCIEALDVFSTLREDITPHSSVNSI